MDYFEDEPGSFHAFRSQKGTVYSIQQVNRLIKKYFKGSRLSTHPLRKKPLVVRYGIIINSLRRHYCTSQNCSIIPQSPIPENT